MPTTKCPYCSEEIQEEAQVCKHCKTDFAVREKADKKAEAERKKKKMSNTIAVVVGLLFIIGMAKCSSGFSSTSPYSSSSSSSSGVSLDGQAIGCGKDKVRNMLKSPSTADFQSIFDQHVTHNGSDYTVTGYVDAQNSFGAKLRNTYVCSLNLPDSYTCTGSCSLN